MRRIPATTRIFQPRQARRKRPAGGGGNSAPVITVPGSQSSTWASYVDFGAAISIADADSDAQEVTLSCSHGTLTLSGTTGLSFTTGDGTSDAAMEFSGSLTNVNAALNGLLYYPNTDYAGSDTIVIDSNDGTDDATQKTVAISVVSTQALGSWKVETGYVWQDEYGMTPAGVGDPIRRIDDQGTGGNNAVAPADSNRLTRTSDGAQGDGTDDFFDCSNAGALQLSSGTMRCRIKTSDAGSSYRAMMAKASAYGIFLLDNDFSLYDWGAGIPRSSGSDPTNDAMRELTVVFDSGVTNGTKLYLDGSLVLTTTMTVTSQASSLQLFCNFSTYSQCPTATASLWELRSEKLSATQVAHLAGGGL